MLAPSSCSKQHSLVTFQQIPYGRRLLIEHNTLVERVTVQATPTVRALRHVLEMTLP
jgi:hypothetical protein